MKLVSSLISLTFILTSHFSYAETFVLSQEASELLLHPTRSSPALVIALNHSVIPAQTSGVVTKLMVNVGDQVLKGEILATLDCQINTLNHNSEFAQYNQLYSELLFKKRELVRGRSLLKQKNIGEAELDRLNNAVENTRGLLQAKKAAVDNALLNVERCNIKAPYDGVVTKRVANLGEMIDFGRPLVELIEDKRLEVSAKIASSDAESFHQAKIYNVDINGEFYPVTLRAYLPLIEENARSREARFLFVDKQAVAGDTGRLRWENPLPYLPAYLLQKRKGKSGYFVVENNKAKFITVEQAEEGRPITYELAPSTQIITEGRQGLEDGDAVKLANPSNKARAESGKS
ncbi:efflux RND transporter periplasmic adaptor subunit [Pseudocolwellia sp. HL-MZ19]|uniref:efflux RND transporter periplasmic adaptor subunit n=1 Tax=unclassified Pseudocolwellia TaxID=2848178 RepID=UPI003CEDF2CE